MQLVPSVAAMHADITGWRRDLHANPELGYDVNRTAAFVAEKLREFGCDDIVTGIGRTGVVGVVKGRTQSSGRVIGMRADMDALPIQEATALPYASQTPDKMHACGHDGHTTMLLGAARYLAETRNFDGTAVMIFQPAEEGGAGAKAMCEDGLMARWNIQRVFAMHNEPGMAIGRFSTRPGPIGAAVDGFRIAVVGKGAHSAEPHLGVDAVVAGANIVMAFQSIVARNIDPLKGGVVTVSIFRGGDSGAVVAPTAELRGTVRAFKPEVRDLLQRRVTEIAQGIAASYGAVATVNYRRIYPSTVNDPAETAFAVAVARAVAGEANVDADKTPTMGSEDFSFMLEERPGNVMLIGNGSTAPLHDSAYDFNDAALPYGVSYWVRLIEMGMPCEP